MKHILCFYIAFLGSLFIVPEIYKGNFLNVALIFVLELAVYVVCLLTIEHLERYMGHD